jgi:methylated-DNA-protein-cysteine methyltransferase-like protein
VSSAGRISSRGPGTDGAERQSEALQAEDVEVRVGRTNELLVDLAAYGWFPAPGTITPTAP